MTVYDMILVIFGSALLMLLVGFGFLLVGTLAGRFYAEPRRIPVRQD
jgi:hypothetical protein